MTINGKTLVHVTSGIDGTVLGLYLVPTENIDAFTKGLENAEYQNDFDEENDLGAERIFADDIIIENQFL
jgi:hypothetical protein